MQRSLDTNLHGPIKLTRAALPHFRSKGDQGQGLLIYMSSQAGFYGEPAAAGYCASKFALEGTGGRVPHDICLPHDIYPNQII
jgi:NAD(P)-dependent dehydrogenase (short-subunit alcohol dehydrogenase family)